MRNAWDGWVAVPLERLWRALWNAWYRLRQTRWDPTQVFKYHLDFRPVVVRALPTGTLQNGAWLSHLETVGWRFTPK